MSWVWALMLLCAFEGLGVDHFESGRCLGSNIIVRGGEVLLEQGYCRERVRAEKPESLDCPDQALCICGLKISAQSWDNIRSGVRREGYLFLQVIQIYEHHDGRVSDSRIWVRKVGEHNGLSQECVCPQVTEYECDVLFVKVCVRERVGHDIEQGGQTGFAHGAQSLKSPIAFDIVGAVEERSQSWNSWFSLVPKSRKTCNGFGGTSRFSVTGIYVEEDEPVREFRLQGRRASLNPFEQEWQGIGADLLDGVRALCLIDVGAGLIKPFTQGSAAVTGVRVFADYEGDCSDGAAGKQEAEKDSRSLHAPSMPLEFSLVNHNCYALRS